MTAVEILAALVAFPTPSPKTNVPLLDWVTDYLRSRGWRIQRYAYSDDNGVAKENLVARPPVSNPNEAIDLAFVCHTDTVPYAAGWKSALELRVIDGLAHGCGACDVKGALACFLAAIAAIPDGKLNQNIALILTADEEVGCKGMEQLLRTTTLRIGSAIVSEPTSLRPGIAGKGYGLARVTIQGAEAHSAFPSEGISAIDLAARFLSELKQSDGDHTQPKDPLFEPPRTSMNVGLIQGGSAKNIIAGECSFLIEWRPVPSDRPQRIQDEIHRISAELESADPRIRIRVEPLRAEAGFAPASAGPLRKKLAELSDTPRQTTGISFGSEATRLSGVADEVIVIGPGDMHTAHSERECVSVAELDEWTATLQKLLQLSDQRV